MSIFANQKFVVPQIQINNTSCNSHPNCRYTFLNLGSNDEFTFKCEECVIECESTKDYLSISSIFQCNNDYVFKNWPPVNDETLLKKISQAFQNSGLIKQQINVMYDHMLKQLYDKIISMKNQAIQQVVQNETQLKGIYNQLSGKQQLKQFIQINDTNISQKNQEVKKFQSSMRENCVKTTQKLTQQLDKINSLLNSFQVLDGKAFIGNFLNQFDSFQVFPDQKQNILSLQKTLEVKKILNSLIDNKYNYVNPSFMNSFNKIFDQFGSIFNSLQTENIQNKSVILKDKFYSKSYTKLEQLIVKMIEDTKNSDHEFAKSLRQTKYYEFNYKGQFIENDFFGQYMKSSYNDSNKIKVVENIQEKIIQVQKNSDLIGGMYFKYDLVKDSKYIVRFRLNKSAGDYVIVGLVNKNNASQSQLKASHQGKTFGQYNDLYCGKVVEGKYMWRLQAYEIIEMRIDISNKKIQFLDYPHYNNTNELNDQYLLNPDDTYHLAIQFGSDTKFDLRVDLLTFQKVNSFNRTLYKFDLDEELNYYESDQDTDQESEQESDSDFDFDLLC